MNIDRNIEIMKVAEQLFLEKGYSATTIREIAEKANVSLGLIHYYYKSKKKLALNYIDYLFSNIKNVVSYYIDQDKNPMLYSACFINASCTFFYQNKFRNFYIECLKEDIHTEAINKLSIETMMKIVNFLQVDVSEEYLELYGRYIPSSIERTLVINIDNQNILSVDFEKVPEIVFRSSVERFVKDNKIILNYCKEAKEYIPEIIEKLNAI